MKLITLDNKIDLTLLGCDHYLLTIDKNKTIEKYKYFSIQLIVSHYRAIIAEQDDLNRYMSIDDTINLLNCYGKIRDILPNGKVYIKKVGVKWVKSAR